MKKLNSAVALAALAAVMTTPAFAADVEPAPAAADWTAFHVGIGGGGNFAFADDSVNAYHHHVNNGEFLDGQSFSDLGKAGAFATIEAGYDYQMNNIVLGVLANYDFGKTQMDVKSDAALTDNNGNFLETGTLKASWDIGDSWAVGGRLGFLATDSTLIYVLGGYTQAKIEESVDLFSNNHNSNWSSDDWEDGYFVGGGIETMLTNSDRKSTRLNSSHIQKSRMPSSA